VVVFSCEHVKKRAGCIQFGGLPRKWSSQEGLCSAGLVDDINTSNFNMLAYLFT
jgi:hypothetical protein